MKKSIIFLVLSAVLFLYSGIIFAEEVNLIEKKEVVVEKRSRCSFTKNEILDYISNVIKENDESIQSAAQSREFVKIKYSFNNDVAEEVTEYMSGCNDIIDEREKCNARMGLIKNRLALTEDDQNEIDSLMNEVFVCHDNTSKSVIKKAVYYAVIFGEIRGGTKVSH